MTRSPDDATPVSFELSPARHGWISLTIAAGGTSDTIRCSHVYDPFRLLCEMFYDAAASSCPGHVNIDEEGRSTIVRIDVEPGERVGRLRVFESGSHSGVERMCIDVLVDTMDMARSWHEAFSAYGAAYDARHWQPEESGDLPRGVPPHRTLQSIRVMRFLGWMVNPDPDVLRAIDEEHAAQVAGES